MVDVHKLLRRLSEDVDLKIIIYRLGKTAKSSGANYEEAQAYSGDKFFHYESNRGKQLILN